LIGLGAEQIPERFDFSGVPSEQTASGPEHFPSPMDNFLAWASGYRAPGHEIMKLIGEVEDLLTWAMAWAKRNSESASAIDQLQLPTVAVLTVIGPELAAMKVALGITESDRRCGQGDVRYDKVIDTRYSGKVLVQVHVQGKAGQAESAAESARIIAGGARFMLLAGIAAGIKGKVKIGDIIVPRAVADTTKKVLEAEGVKARPEIIGPLVSVLKMNASAQIDKEAFWQLFRQILPAPITPPPEKAEWYAQHVSSSPLVHESVILSDNILHRDPAILIDAANDLHQQIRSGEMEAAGFANACMGHYPPVPWFVVRSISDFGDSEKSDDFHKIAARAAAAYVAVYLKQVLDLRIWTDGSDPPTSGKDAPVGTHAGQTKSNPAPHKDIGSSLSKLEFDILIAVANHKRATVRQVASAVHATEQKAKFFLDELAHKHRLLDWFGNMDRSISDHYTLTHEGRRLLVDRGVFD